jgi:aminoglycoside phosphotransferase (APT) family kinase protein
LLPTKLGFVRPGESELRAGLERALGDAGFELAGGVERRPYAYRTSFPLEELRVELVGEGHVTLLFKQLDWDDLEPEAQLAKPRFLHDPGREPAVYAVLLPQAPSGPPRYFGSAEAGGRRWLFLERVEGRELFQVGDRELWEAAARWLGEMHAGFAALPAAQAEAAHLLVHDAAYHRRWVERAREFAREPSQPSERARAVDRLAGAHEQVVEALAAEPRTVLHGEFYAANVLVARPGCASSRERVNPMPFDQRVRVAPVDWEVAAVGPGLTDLAALVGGWSDEDRGAIAAAYASVAGGSLAGLDYARLQLALQWLGWAPPSWTPPEGQRHDWLAEALELAERLGL